MGRSHQQDEEFPLLSALALYAADIRGDGNCLFNALSDQLYGHQGEHHTIRARVIDYMREHAAYYKQFIDVHPGGGIRRNPKRKNAGAYSSPTTYLPPSEADVDRVFDSHLHSMARGGTYGDNMEITAFASAYSTDVKIYQRDFAYMVTAPAAPQPDDTTTTNLTPSARPVAHIAYHLWEHYSSIRNLAGPHSGLPHVQPKVLTLEEEAQQKERLAQTPYYVAPWMVEVVEKSLPFLADKPTIKRALEAAKGDVNLAVSRLLEAEEYGGSAASSSQQESSSVERDHDSGEEDMQNGPNKKRDRRLSRASRALHPRSVESTHALAKLTQDDGSQESVNSYDSEASSGIEVSQPPMDSQQLNGVGESNATLKPEGDVPASGSQSPSKPSIKLKLHPPKPPEPAQRIGKTQQRQPGPRVTARERKEIKKQQQKAARKERQQAAVRGTNRSRSPSAIGLALRQKGMAETPPVETLRTLYI